MCLQVLLSCSHVFHRVSTYLHCFVYSTVMICLRLTIVRCYLVLQCIRKDHLNKTRHCYVILMLLRRGMSPTHHMVHWLPAQCLCRMSSLLPVAILAMYNSSARPAVSESPNSKSGLVYDRSNSSMRPCRTVL